MSLATAHRPQTADATCEFVHTPESKHVDSFRRAIEEISPELIRRSLREPLFRSSLLADPELTVSSELKRLKGVTSPFPQGMNITIVEDLPGRINLVVPNPSTSVEATPQPTVLSQILADAAGDRALRIALVDDGRITLNRELARRTGGTASISADLEVQVHQVGADEVVVVIPTPNAWTSDALLDRTFDLSAQCHFTSGSQAHTICNYCGKTQPSC